MMWLLFEIGVNLYQAMLILYFMKSRLNIIKEEKLIDVLFLLLCTVYSSASLFFDVYIDDIYMFFIPYLYALVMSTDKWSISVFWTVTLAVLFASTVGLVSHIFMSVLSLQMNAVMQPGLLRVCFIIATNTILTLIIYSASKLERDNLFLSWRPLLSFLSISISILIAEESFFSLQSKIEGSATVFNLGYASLLVGSFMSILLFHFMTETSKNENRYKSEASLYEISRQHQNEFSQMYSDFISRQHDFKHQLDTLEELIKENNNTDAQTHLINYRAELSEARTFMTGSMPVDALLTAKQLTMKNNDITFKLIPYPLNSLPISTTDFCSIIGNLLDNAIEGSLRVVDPSLTLQISLSFARTYNMFHITCKNFCNICTIRQKNNMWISSKKAEQVKGIHGLGIPSIQRIVDKAEGHCAISIQDDVFIVELTIPYPIH